MVETPGTNFNTVLQTTRLPNWSVIIPEKGTRLSIVVKDIMLSNVTFMEIVQYRL